MRLGRVEFPIRGSLAVILYNNAAFREGEQCRHVTLLPFGKAA
jgi:hypothetical protein